MKITAEMFDFEKYDYSFGAISADKEYANIVNGAWTQAYLSDEGGSMRIMRKLKPPPRYILLNEGEALQAGDQYYSPLVNSWQAGIGNSGTRKACSGEVWRRKDTTK